jgi:transposase-like protein
MPLDSPRLQHPPCPECRSLQVIEVEGTPTTQALYCPDCGHAWERVMKFAGSREAIDKQALRK